MRYKYVLFDLDGTLTDSKEGITKSVQYALGKYNIAVENLDLLEVFIGPPLKDSFMQYYNFSEEQALHAIGYYREYFETKGIFQNKVYENIEGLLKKLKKLKLNLIVATSKPTEFAKRILKHFNLYSYFDTVVGSNLDGTRCKKGEVIGYIIDKYNIGDNRQVVMVGDRRHDVIGALENGIDCIGVAYGYGSVEELRNAKAAYIVHDVNELFQRIISV
ncbi:HAD hydrolase-like protein [Clostridium sp. WLY-B-L2]|uniref:HAD hydrolase-like protein n=1 Tax=Clostridium aromativorans TaxID=2836848 RepID=A0ABS8N3D4_9CLOT|nr:MULTISPECIES: HAD hydrolase-like protein [Clostridium]KAA8679383.1 HAD hydrolase-like protein [Clostridium sp. HV4-5-A1G]MCC9294321.1 HAD hydrolase-like protein [Clostridium aromativorans]